MARGDLWDSAEVGSEKSFDIEYGSMPPCLAPALLVSCSTGCRVPEGMKPATGKPRPPHLQLTQVAARDSASNIAPTIPARLPIVGATM